LASPSDAATDEVDLVDPLTVEPVDLEAAGGACIIAGVFVLCGWSRHIADPNVRIVIFGVAPVDR
jgi:hypothetical protein